MLTYTKLLSDFISFKSVSTDSLYSSDLRKVVAWLQKLFVGHGFRVETWQGKNTNPVIYAMLDANKPETVLVYGHYDVQPADKKNGWKSDPFKLDKRNNRFWGRGVVDNKGQILVHIVSVLELLASGKLNKNVIFLIEGNEETGNSDLPQIVRKYKSKLKSDFIMVSDGELVGNNPTLDASFRGFINFSIKLKTAKNRLHSGIFGGALPNAAIELGQLIASFYKGNKVAIAGFYEGTKKITKEQLVNNKLVEKLSEDVTRYSGAKSLVTEPGLDFYSQTGLRPTLQVTGMHGGYTGAGFANIVPNEASVKINVRTAPGQEVKIIFTAIKRHAVKMIPNYVEATISLDIMDNGVELDVDSDDARQVKSLLEKIYKKRVLVRYVGGIVPILLDFKKILGVEPMSVSLGNDDANVHGLDENFRIDLVERGLEFSKRFFGSI